MNEAEALADAARPAAVAHSALAAARTETAPGWRRLCRPWLTLLLLIVLWLDACSLPRSSLGGVLLSGRWLIPRARTTCYFAPGNWAVERTSNGLTLAEQTTPASVGYACAHDFFDGRSIWAPMRATHTIRFSINLDNGAIPSAGEAASLRTQAAGSLRHLGHAWLADHIAAGDRTVATVRWAGIGHNIAAAAIAACLLRSLSWLGDRPRRLRRAHALANGVCPACTYEINGLPNPICPECGERLRPA